MQESIVFLVRVQRRTTSSQRKFTFAISSPDEFLVLTGYSECEVAGTSHCARVLSSIFILNIVYYQLAVSSL